MAEEKFPHINPFMVIALLIVAMTGAVIARVYIVGNFPIFTDEEQIEEAKSQEFGAISNYL